MWREAATQTALDIPGVRQADDLFQGIADELDREFDGWEAAV
jgi:hypothetical protein